MGARGGADLDFIKHQLILRDNGYGACVSEFMTKSPGKCSPWRLPLQKNENWHYTPSS